jgi:hypothetical protein
MVAVVAVIIEPVVVRSTNAPTIEGAIMLEVKAVAFKLKNLEDEDMVAELEHGE